MADEEPDGVSGGTPPEPRPDPGLRGVDYAGVSPLTIPAEALVRSIEALSNLFWISIAGTVVTIFLAAVANLDGAATGSLEFGEYQIPLAVLPIACLSFAMFLLWLTAARLRMLLAALGDDDLTTNLARDIFRLDPPVLDVFDAGNLRWFALLSGFSMLLWIWSLFFGSSIGLIFSAIVIPSVAASEDESLTLLIYAVATLATMVYGVARIIPLLRRIHEKLHDERLKVGPTRMAVAILVVVAGVLLTNPELPGVLAADEYRIVGPARANAVDGETLIMKGETIVLLGIDAFRPGQTCFDREGAPYPCGDRATVYLQSLISDVDVLCYVYYPNLGICVRVPEGSPLPEDLADLYVEQNLQATMVARGLALADKGGAVYLGPLQDRAQRNRVGVWQGAFEPPGRQTGTR
ncbi:MAG: thermonuclease family protein [Gammaproteobacteria bacterium]|nr:thermonuclease family protein [Gammaproteobacteria bacterium]